MKRLVGQKGLSLVEVTIMLLVLMLLTSVLAPSIFDFVNDARWVKVKEDCEAIGITVARLNRDIGSCIKFNGTQPCTMSNRVDILFSDGPEVAAGAVDATAVDFANSNMSTTPLNWDDDNVASVGDWMESQFVTNANGYNTPLLNYPGSYPVGPLYGIGWRGGYLASPIGPDPWGSRYLVNSVFLATATDAITAGEGHRSRWWERDVICISAGPNALFQTPIGGNGASAGTTRVGDDFIYIIQGSMR